MLGGWCDRDRPRRRHDVPPDGNRLMAAWLKRKLDAIYEEEWRAADEYWMKPAPRRVTQQARSTRPTFRGCYRAGRDHGDLEQLRALYPELKDFLKKPDRPEERRFHPNKFQEAMKEVWGNATVARVVQDAARIRKLWLDHFGWKNSRPGYWKAEEFAAERRIARRSTLP